MCAGLRQRKAAVRIPLQRRTWNVRILPPMDSQVRWPMLPPVCTGLDSGNRGASESSSGRRGGSRAQAEGGTEMRK